MAVIDYGTLVKKNGKIIVENYHGKDMNFKFHFHSMNPVGIQNMKSAVEKILGGSEI